MQASRKLSPFTVVLLFTVLLLLMSFVGVIHYASDLTDEAIEKERRPQRVSELYGRGYRPDLPQRLVLLHPMECAGNPDATVNQRVYFAEAGVTRCYSRGAQ